MERVAGIEPASLAWKARGYSRRWLIIFNVSNSKPNMKFWFHSAPLWIFSPLNIYVSFSFCLNGTKALCFLDDPYRVGDRNSPKYLSNLLTSFPNFIQEILRKRVGFPPSWNNILMVLVNQNHRFLAIGLPFPF